MSDREKVINGLREMSCRATWKDIDRIRHKFQPIVNDAIAMLKEQEPKPPIVHENSYGWKFYYCPNCEKEFYQNRKQAYCEKCGQAVKWE